METRGVTLHGESRSSGTTLNLSSYEPHVRMPAHRHGYEQLYVLLDGRYEARWGRDRAVCRRGELVVHPAGTWHEDVLLDRNCTSLRIEWSPGADLPWGVAPRSLKLQSARVSSLAHALGEELALGDTYSETIVEGLARALCGAYRRSIDPGVETPPDWMLEARAFVRAHYLEPIGLRHVAASVGRASNRVAESFRRYFGVSVGEMVRQLRVEHAQQLMDRNELELADIALASGFCDQAHMGRVFRSQEGTSPATWRAERRRAGLGAERDSIPR